MSYVPDDLGREDILMISKWNAHSVGIVQPLSPGTPVIAQ
jgi:hypothetical protein